MNELYVVISKDEKGDGICAMMTGNGGMPMVFGRKELLDDIRPIVKEMAEATGLELRIVRYTKQELIEEF